MNTCLTDFFELLMRAKPEDIDTSFDDINELLAKEAHKKMFDEEEADDAIDEDDIPEFARGATNVYRTKYYIVRQMLMINAHEIFGPHTVSRDIYYERTPERDAEYEKFFAGVPDIDGRRIPSMGYVRSYRA